MERNWGGGVSDKSASKQKLWIQQMFVNNYYELGTVIDYE